MRVRRIVGFVLAFGFVAVVASVSAAVQCPARELGACARLHLELMRPRSAAPVSLVARPMRGDTERG